MHSLTKLSSMNAENRKFVRDMLFYVNEVEIDSQGRILIPPQLMQLAKFDKEIDLIGTLESIEIWNPQTKTNFDSSSPVPFSEIAEKISQLNVDIRL